MGRAKARVRARSHPPYGSKYEDISDEDFKDDSEEESNPDYEPVRGRHPCYLCQFYGTEHTGAKHETVEKPFKGKSKVRWVSGQQAWRVTRQCYEHHRSVAAVAHEYEVETSGWPPSYSPFVV